MSVVLVIRGHGRVRLDSGPAIPVEPGSVVLTPTGHRMWRSVQQALLGFVNVPPGGDRALQACGLLASGARHWQIADPNAMLARLIALADAGRAAPHQLNVLLPQLMAVACDLLAEDHGEQQANTVGSEAEGLIARIACDPRPLPALIPDYHSWRQAVRPHLSASPAALRRRQRMRTAERLLGDPELTIADIARLCGYATPEAFNRTFKAHAGVAPSRWRARSTT